MYETGEYDLWGQDPVLSWLEEAKEGCPSTFSSGTDRGMDKNGAENGSTEFDIRRFWKMLS